MTQKNELSIDITKIYSPNGKSLGSLFAGTSGSGKTTAILTTLQAAIKSKEFGEFHRFVIVDPKTQSGDYDILAQPLSKVEDVFKSIRKNRVTLFWPNMDFLEDDIESVISYIFQLSDSEPKTSFTFVLDEAAIVMTPAKLPTEIKRLAVQGRSKRIMPIYASQRPLINRWTDANLSSMFLFRTLQVDADVLNKRFGVDFEAVNAKLLEKEYSFIHFDLETGGTTPVNPLPLPKLPKPPKKRRSAFFR